MNDYEIGKEILERSSRPIEPVIIKLDIKNVRLTDFMKALGQEHPVAANGNLRIYKAPYDAKGEPTMVINTETTYGVILSPAPTVESMTLPMS